MHVLDLSLLLNFTICMQVTLQGAWMKYLSTTKRTSSFFFWFLQVGHLLAFLWPSLFVSLVILLAIDLLFKCLFLELFRYEVQIFNQPFAFIVTY